MKYLIVGLGNIGSEYAETRHNIGFMVVDEIAQQQQIRFSSGRYAFEANFKYKGRQIHLIKPTTYMNLSGKAVNYWLQQLKIPTSNLLVVTDDIALPFGTLRMRGKGSDGGHNGLKDINAVLGHNNYPRLRFGVGNDFAKGRQADYVLSNWDSEQESLMSERIDQAEKMCLSFGAIGLAQTMSNFNGK